jgi:hypothetical protein
MELERVPDRAARHSSQRRDDQLGPEYDPSVLKSGVRGKYLERYKARTNRAPLAPESPNDISHRRVSRQGNPFDKTSRQQQARIDTDGRTGRKRA